MILITGCNGLLGSFIARKLLSQNYYVRALRRKDSDLSLIKDIEHKIEWVEGDINDISILEKALSGIDTVIHSAAIVSFSPSQRDAMFKTNVDGTQNLVNAALRSNTRLFVHISSVAALGRKKDLKKINEEVYWENSNLNSNYAISKYHAELEVWRGREEGLNTIIVNPSIILGPGDINSGSTRIFKYAIGNHLFYPTGVMNFVDVRDVATIVVQLMEAEKAIGHRYVLNGYALPYKYIFALIASSFNKKAPGIEAGRILTEIAWRLEAVRALFTNHQPSLTKETAKAAKHQFYYDSAKVCKFLNYTFHKPEETIQWTSEELKKRLKI